MMMQMGSRASESYWRTQGMARTLGVDLTGAMLEGWISRTDFAGMVLNCQLCPHSKECDRWLATHGAGSDSLPEYCANKARLESLRPA